MSELLHQLEFVLTHLGATLAFPLYLIWLLYTFGTGALTVLVVVTLVYATLDVSAALCALAVVDRPGFALRSVSRLPAANDPARRLRAGVGIRRVAT